MIEKLLRWLLPDLYKKQQSHQEKLAEISRDMEKDRATTKALLRVAAKLYTQSCQAEQAQQWASEGLRDFDRRLHLLEALARETLKSLPLSNSKPLEFPLSIQKGDRAWPRAEKSF